MKKLLTLVLLTSFLYTCSFAQDSDESNYFSCIYTNERIHLNLSQLSLDFDYCFKGRIRFYNHLTGQTLGDFSVGSHDLDALSFKVEQASIDGSSIHFKIFLKQCSDEYHRIINNAGITKIPPSREPDFDDLLKYEDHISITFSNDNASTFLANKKNQKAQEEANKRKKEEEKNERITKNKNRTISEGELLYICNRRRRCQVIAQVITKEKVKVEFIEQCHPKKFSTISTRIFISEGDTRWIDKEYLHADELNCYGEKSPF